jgi:MFS family permease
MNQKQFNRWAKIKEKGQLRYVVVQSLIISLAIFIGRLIGFFIMDDNVWPGSFFYDNMSNFIFIILFSPFIVLVFWYIQESSFKKELKVRDRTSKT